MKSSPRQTSGANPMAWSAPSTRPQVSDSRWRSASVCSRDVTSNSSTSVGFGNLRAVRSVRRRPLPAPVSTTSAPSSWASRATEKARDASVSTPVMSSRLPSTIPTCLRLS